MGIIATRCSVGQLARMQSQASTPMSATRPTRSRKTTALKAAKPNRAQRLAEEKFQCLLELAADFYWEQDENHRFSVYRHRHAGSPSSEAYDIVGKTSWELSEPPVETSR